MASRKEQKDQARAARLAREQELAAKVQQTRRFQIFGGVIAVAVIVLVVVIVISSSGGSKSPDTTHVATSSAGKQAAAQVDALLNGIPQSGSTLGNPNAKVTLDYFGDLQCPICKEFTLDVFPTFVSQEVRTGKVKVVYKSLCTASCNNQSVSDPQGLFYKQQIAALAAGPQDKFWYYTELFYHLQGTEDTSYVTETYLRDLADLTPGLNTAQWLSARNNAAFKAQVTADGNLASKYGTSSTPSLFVFGTKGRAQQVGADSVPTAAQLEAAVKAVSS